MAWYAIGGVAAVLAYVGLWVFIVVEIATAPLVDAHFRVISRPAHRATPRSTVRPGHGRRPTRHTDNAPPPSEPDIAVSNTETPA
jgi:hypothetical protein